MSVGDSYIWKEFLTTGLDGKYKISIENDLMNIIKRALYSTLEVLLNGTDYILYTVAFDNNY